MRDTDNGECRNSSQMTGWWLLLGCVDPPDMTIGSFILISWLIQLTFVGLTGEIFWGTYFPYPDMPFTYVPKLTMFSML